MLGDGTVSREDNFWELGRLLMGYYKWSEYVLTGDMCVYCFYYLSRQVLRVGIRSLIGYIHRVVGSGLCVQ